MEFRYFFSPILLYLFLAGQIHAQSMDLYAFSEVKSNGDVASIDIRVNHFSDIISFQASINWDPALMTFTGVTDFGISGLSEENFGDASAGQGHLRFVWDPEDANALTLVDSTVLFTANFELKTIDPLPIAVSFMDVTSNPPFPIEFANSNSDKLTVNTFDGSIVYEPKVTGLAWESNTISISPNPFQKTIRISTGDQLVDFIKIYNVSGHLIAEKHNLRHPFANIELNNSPNGIYLVKLRANGKTLTRKIIKNTEK